MIFDSIMHQKQSVGWVPPGPAGELTALPKPYSWIGEGPGRGVMEAKVGAE